MTIDVKICEANETIKKYENLGNVYTENTILDAEHIRLIFRDPVVPNKDLIEVPIKVPFITNTSSRVFIFKGALTYEEADRVSEWIYKNIKKGVLVIPDSVKFIGVEDLFKSEKLG